MVAAVCALQGHAVAGILSMGGIASNNTSRRRLAKKLFHLLTPGMTSRHPEWSTQLRKERCRVCRPRGVRFIPASPFPVELRRIGWDVTLRGRGVSSLCEPSNSFDVVGATRRNFDVIGLDAVASY